jgi:hypothetical protein
VARGDPVAGLMLRLNPPGRRRTPRGGTSIPRREKDEPDNRILECAVAGRAEVIVTGDKALLALKRYKTIQVLTLRGYLDRP